jgi:hypothetical protein
MKSFVNWYYGINSNLLAFIYFALSIFLSVLDLKYILNWVVGLFITDYSITFPTFNLSNIDLVSIIYNFAVFIVFFLLLHRYLRMNYEMQKIKDFSLIIHFLDNERFKFLKAGGAPKQLFEDQERIAIEKKLKSKFGDDKATYFMDCLYRGKDFWARE